MRSGGSSSSSWNPHTRYGHDVPELGGSTPKPVTLRAYPLLWVSFPAFVAASFALWSIRSQPSEPDESFAVATAFVAAFLGIAIVFCIVVASGIVILRWLASRYPRKQPED
jgi:hypothetical protein